MKVLCTRDNLKRGISRCERSIGKNPTLPVLGNVLIEAEKGILKLTSTNLEIGVVSTVRARIEKEGKTTVPAQLLSGVVNNLKDEQINLELLGKNLKISSENFESKLRTIPAEDFPLIPKIEEGTTWKIKGKTLAESLKRIIPSLATLETKLELTGICLTFKSGEVAIAATDGYRLAERKIKIENKTELDSVFIIPGRSAQEIERIFNEEEKEISIITSENQIAFQSEDVYFVSRLIEGQYPEYRQIIPSDFKAKFSLEKEVLVNSLRLAGVFSSNQTRDVKIKLLDDQISLHTVSSDLGEQSSIIKAETEGEKLEVVFNYQFLQDGLQSLPEEEVTFSLNGSEGPSMIKGIDRKSKQEISDFIYIVMPIRQ